MLDVADKGKKLNAKKDDDFQRHATEVTSKCDDVKQVALAKQQAHMERRAVAAALQKNTREAQQLLETTKQQNREGKANVNVPTPCSIDEVGVAGIFEANGRFNCFVGSSNACCTTCWEAGLAEVVSCKRPSTRRPAGAASNSLTNATPVAVPRRP